MDNNKSPKSPKQYQCSSCDYTCSKQSDFNKHLATGKHKRITMDNSLDNKIAPREYKCECDRKYIFCSGLSKHKKKCSFITSSEIKQYKTEEVIPNNRDVVIEKLVEELTAERAEKSEMKSMFMVMMEKIQEMQQQNQEMQQQNKELQMKTNENTREMLKETIKGSQELVNKVIDVIPKMGNTTNNNNNTTNNNTLNFYLTNTCKDAESIHDFTDRYVKQCKEFFMENYRSIANNQMCLATNVYNIMFTCLKENPQYLNFIQTTDVKNGIHYVKEKRKDKDRQLYGEAEFIKYVDGFERAGASIGHAINKAFVPLQSEFSKKLELEVGRPPNEDDYEDEEEYEDLLDKYKQRKSEAGRHLNKHIFNAMSLFDSSSRKMEVLTKTRRIKADDTIIA
jgi:hypothetical protein